MPRKKIVDPIDQILSFAETAETSTILIVIGLLNREVKKRQPPEEKKVVVRRRRNKVIVQNVSTETQHVPPTVDALPTPKKPRRRRMRANSKPPASEATPIVPLQAEVGEGDDAYTGQ